MVPLTPSMRSYVVLLVVGLIPACTTAPSAAPAPPATEPRQAHRDVQATAPAEPSAAGRPSGQPEARNSGGELQLPQLRASRTSCVSPCPVMFSTDAVRDTSDDNPFAHSGVYWDYGDPQADSRDGPIERGAMAHRSDERPSRTHDINTPLGMHTYACDTGICTFHPGVAVRNAAGDWATAWSTITVRAQDTMYPGARTVCVSGSGRFGGDVPCPAEAVRRRSLPALGELRNNTRYLLRRGEAFDTQGRCIGYDRRDITITSFGDDADAKPTLGELGLGRARNCGRAVTTDQEIGSYRVPFWVENITLSDLRVHSVALGMTFKDITLHDLDMDFERQLSGGVVYSNATNRCNGDRTLSCGRVPLPSGLYIDSTRIVGSRTTPPGVNVGLVNSTCASFVGILDAEIRVAEEHNVRLECSSRFLALHSDINGEHIGRRGKKHAITIRPAGTLAQDMLLGRRKQNVSRDDVFESRYTVFKDLYLGTEQSVNNAARLTITPTRRGEREVSRFAVVSGNVTDMGAGKPVADVRLAGAGLVCYDDNTWETKQGCVDDGPSAIPAEAYEPAETAFPAPQPPQPPGSY